MISLIIPPKDQISRVNSMLTTEMGTATNIKSRVNKLSVLSAISSVQQRLKLFTKVPPNGLVIYCGTVISDGKEKKVSIDLEPFKPINTSLYICGSNFDVSALKELFDDDEKFGFVVMDGNGCLFGRLQGNNRTVISKFSVDLPKKHGRGGQSSVRFARLRVEKRHHYLRKVAETCTATFITDNRPNVSGLVLAGAAEFKAQLATSDLFDPRLRGIVTAVVDISYGGENGFNQAIELAAEQMADVKFVREKRLLANYFNEIARDTGKYCYGVQDVMSGLEMGAIENLIVWENLPHNRFELRNPDTQETNVLILDAKQEADQKNFTTDSGKPLEILSQEPLIEWLSNNYKSFGASLHFVTNKSQEGSQFVTGFGGIGGILRYKIDLVNLEHVEADVDEDGFI